MINKEKYNAIIEALKNALEILEDNKVKLGLYNKLRVRRIKLLLEESLQESEVNNGA